MEIVQTDSISLWTTYMETFDSSAFKGPATPGGQANVFGIIFIHLLHLFNSYSFFSDLHLTSKIYNLAYFIFAT